MFSQADTVSTKVWDRDRPQVYNYNNKFDIPLTSITAGITIFNFTQIYTKKATSQETILALDPEDVNRFDRRAAGNYNEKAKTTSDFFFNASIPLPLIVFAFDDAMREDYLRLTLLYLEAMSITGITYSTSQQLNDRLRPFTYNENLPIEERTKGGARNSFFSGHTSLVATSTFFLASTYDDYHPGSKNRWLFYAGAATATVLTGHFRMRAGQHFPTDVIVGGLVGTASGFLIPKLHKNKDFREKGLTVLPVSGDYHGLRLTYQF